MNEALIEAAVKRMEGQNNYAEGRCDADTTNNTKFGVWYGMNCAAWCAMFVSWAFYLEGLPLPASTSKGFAFTPSGAQWFKDQGAWASPTTAPRRGWVVFFYSSSAGRIAHVGAVRGPKGSDGLIPTVEGNTNSAGSAEGGSVMLKRRSPSQSLGFRIAGYGRPELLEVGLSAAEVTEIKTHIDTRFNQLREELTVSGTTGLEQTMELLYQRAKAGDINSANIKAQLADLATKEETRAGAVLAALAAIEIDLTPEQIQQISQQIDVDESQVAEAVRARLFSALSE